MSPSISSNLGPSISITKSLKCKELRIPFSNRAVVWSFFFVTIAFVSYLLGTAFLHAARNKLFFQTLCAQSLFLQVNFHVSHTFCCIFLCIPFISTAGAPVVIIVHGVWPTRPSHLSYSQGGRTWQPFVGSKNGNENFRQARNYNFCVKCFVFARNRKFAKLNQWNMLYIPCNSALLAQETLFLTQKGTFFAQLSPKSA